MGEAIFVEGLTKTAPKAGRPAPPRDRKPGRLCIGRFPGGAINHLLGDVRMHGDRASLAVLRLRRKTDRPLRCGDPMGRALDLPSAKGEQKSGFADIPGVVLDDPAGIHTIIRKQIARCLALRRKGGVHKPGGLAAVDHRPLKAPAHHRGPFLSGAPRRQDGNYAENNCQQAGGNSFSHVVISFFTWLFVI